MQINRLSVHCTKHKPLQESRQAERPMPPKGPMACQSPQKQGKSNSHLSVQQQEQRVVRSRVSSPLQHVRQEQELCRERRLAPAQCGMPPAPGRCPVPCEPGHCPPGGPALSQRPVRSFFRQPGSQRSLRLVQLLQTDFK